ncbi:MAG: phosphoribosylformylglycinamidine cyclo-ligase [Myxococcota bacterium]
MSEDAYKQAGVDIEAGDAVVRGIREHIRSTFREGVLGSIGGFGGLFALGKGYRDPVLVSGTDGVGTKLLIAQRLDVHDSIGIDLVAMCVNDIATSGAEPLFFLDYFATGALRPDVAVSVVSGIAEGCRQAGCALIGGETAEMPGMYAPGHYDLAGFCVGIVERDQLPDPSTISVGDRLVAVPSSGLHSNGFSLVRRIVDDRDWSQSYDLGLPLKDVLLTPTRIYTRQCRTLLQDFGARGLAHITGGGLLENVPRVLPDHLDARIDRGSWPRPPIFAFLEAQGGLSEREMHRTFNNGVGLVAVVPAERAPAAAAAVDGTVIGAVVERDTGADARVVLR